MPEVTSIKITIDNILAAAESLQGVTIRTPLLPDPLLSGRFGANISLKREDLQVVRSYKIRGAYNKIQGIPLDQLENGVVCASAGNHAQGVAMACCKKGIHAKPESEPGGNVWERVCGCSADRRYV